MIFESGHIGIPSKYIISHYLGASFKTILNKSSTITTRGRLPFMFVRVQVIEQIIYNFSKIYIFRLLIFVLFKFQDLFSLGETRITVWKKVS